MGHVCAHFFRLKLRTTGVIISLLPGLSPRELPSKLPRSSWSAVFSSRELWSEPFSLYYSEFFTFVSKLFANI